MERLRTLLKTGSREETIELGRKLGKLMGPGDVVALVGPLGGGKTTFTKGLALGLGLEDEAAVKSPTFVVMHEYPAKRCLIYHLDLYRLETLGDVDNLGLDELMGAGGVVLIEWARKIERYLPKEFLEIEFRLRSEEEREILFHAHGKHYQDLLEKGLS